MSASRKRSAPETREAEPSTSLARLESVQDLLGRVASARDWKHLFEFDGDLAVDEQLLRMRAVRNRLVRATHPDRSSVETQDVAIAATTNLNRLWDQACAAFDEPLSASMDGGVLGASEPPGRLMPPRSIEPGGSLEMLANASRVHNNTPPTMLERPELGVFVGFGNFDTLQRCRFLPMTTNRCISQDVVAQRVGQNLAHLRKTGAYLDFGQSKATPRTRASPPQSVRLPPSPPPAPVACRPQVCLPVVVPDLCTAVATRSVALVAVREPPSEQIVVDAASGRRYARFYVLDGQHRLSTMVDLGARLSCAPRVHSSATARGGSPQCHLASHRRIQLLASPPSRVPLPLCTSARAAECAHPLRVVNQGGRRQAHRERGAAAHAEHIPARPTMLLQRRWRVGGRMPNPRSRAAVLAARLCQRRRDVKLCAAGAADDSANPRRRFALEHP